MKYTIQLLCICVNSLLVEHLRHIYHQREEAAHFHRLNLPRLDDERAEGAELIVALQFLAEHATESGRLQEAEKYCTRLLDFGGPAKEAAKGLLREIRTAAAASPMDAMAMSPSS